MKRQLPNPILTLFFASLIAGMFGCAGEKDADTSLLVVEVQASEAAERLESESIVVLDVRTPEEVALGRIPGSVNIDIKGPDFADGIAKLDPTKTYMVHCARGVPGGRSRQSIDALESLGVKKIYHMEGGFVAWQEAQNKVEIPAVK